MAKACVLTLVFLAGIAVYFAAAELRRSALEAKAQAARLAVIEERLERALERIESAGRVSAGLDVRMAACEEALARSQRDALETASAAAVQAPEAGGAAEEDAAGEGEKLGLLARLEEDDAEELRSFVRHVVQADREQRRAEQEEAARTARAEFEEFGQGPYGKFNRRVNSIGKKLALTERQKQLYYESLAEYSRRLAEIHQAARDVKDPAAREALRGQRREVQDEFERVVTTTILSPPQGQAFGELHSAERSLGGGDVMWVSTAFSGEGADFIAPSPEVFVEKPLIENVTGLEGGLKVEVITRGQAGTEEAGAPSLELRLPLPPPPAGDNAAPTPGRGGGE
jgi:hypothetical protein